MSKVTFVTVLMNVDDFEEWKPLFDDRHEHRRGYGATRHWLHRAVDDPQFLMVTHEFKSFDEANAFGDYLRGPDFLAQARKDGLQGEPVVHVLEDFEEAVYPY